LQVDVQTNNITLHIHKQPWPNRYAPGTGTYKENVSNWAEKIVYYLAIYQSGKRIGAKGVKL